MQMTVPGLTYAEILDASPVPTSVIDTEGTVAYVNDAFLSYASKVWGHEVRREDRVGKNVREFTTGGYGYDREEWLAFYNSVLKGEPVSWELRGRVSPDQEMCVDVQMNPIKGEDGKALAAVLTWEDVTDRVKRQREERRRTALERVRGSVYEMREATDIQSVLVELHHQLKGVGIQFDNCSVQVVTDEKRRESVSYQITSKGIQSIATTLDLEVNRAVAEAWGGQQVVYRSDLDREDLYGEGELLRGDIGYRSRIRSVVDVPFSHGTIAINSVRPEAFSEEEIETLGQFAAVLSEAYIRFEDIGRIGESEERYRTLFGGIGDGILVHDEEGVVLDANEVTCARLGRSLEELKGMDLRELITEEYALQASNRIQETVAEASNFFESALVSTSGKVIPCEVFEHRIEYAGRRAILSVARDITERKQAEEKLREYSERLEGMVEERTKALGEAQEQLVRRERMAILGQLAGGVGHELRNPLGVIKNAAYYLKMVLEDPEPKVQEMLEILDEEVGTSESIISALLDFARGKPPVRQEVNISDLVGEALSRISVPEDVEVIRQLDETLPVLSADTDQLSQVFGNILLNAVQAMPEGGQLTVKSEVERPEWIAVSFRDTGTGMSAEHLGKVFEPLFTTKARGIGLGLALSRTLAEGHGGTIGAKSEEGRGSTFTVRLPVAGGSVQSEEMGR